MMGPQDRENVMLKSLEVKDDVVVITLTRDYTGKDAAKEPIAEGKVLVPLAQSGGNIKTGQKASGWPMEVNCYVGLRTPESDKRSIARQKERKAAKS